MRRVLLPLLALIPLACGPAVKPEAKSVTAGTAAASGSASAPAKKWTRDEFRALVMGKTPDEVIAAVGKPDKTSDSSDVRRSYWYFKGGLTTDPITGKVDESIQVIVTDGKVTAVSF